MNIYWAKAYRVDNINNKIDALPGKGELSEYVKFYIEALQNSKRIAPHNPSSQDTQVLALIRRLSFETLSGGNINSNEKYREEINRRFLEKEIEAQNKISRMNIEINEGCLIHAFAESNEEHFYLIAKLDWNDYLDKESLKHSSGIGFDKKKLGRSCLVHVDILETDANVASVDISLDTAQVKYFVESFLEVEAVFNDEECTKQMCESVVNLIDNIFQKEFPCERLELKNSFLAKVRSLERVDFPEIVDEVFKPYLYSKVSKIPQEKAKNFLTKVDDLPEVKKFARQFYLVPSAIRAKIISTPYNLGQGIELLIKEIDGNDLKNKIFADKEDNGRGFLKIYTEEEEPLRAFKRQ